MERDRLNKVNFKIYLNILLKKKLNKPNNILNLKKFKDIGKLA
jgi:hypothetical protein